MDPELLKMLVCPETRTSLSLADETLLARVNLAVRAGTLKNRVGRSVDSALEGGLVREDRAVLYPVVDGIPVLLADEAIPLGQLESGNGAIPAKGK